MISAGKKRALAVKKTLDHVRNTQDRTARVERDPVGFVRRFTTPEDRELAGLLASCFAFGNVTTILAKLDDVTRRLTVKHSLVSRVDALGLAGLQAALRDFRHRVFIGDDVARLLHGARMVQKAEGSLGEVVSREGPGRGKGLREGLTALVAAVRAGGLLVPQRLRRGPSHILPDLEKGGGAKRLLLFARWMVRPDDGVDLGLWRFPRRLLVMPVDTHIHKLARNLGFTKSRAVNFRTAEEITRALAAFDPEDPVGYDFALCHLGMVQHCPSRKDKALCEGCGVKPICGHWPASAR